MSYNPVKKYSDRFNIPKVEPNKKKYKRKPKHKKPLAKTQLINIIKRK